MWYSICIIIRNGYNKRRQKMKKKLMMPALLLFFMALGAGASELKFSGTVETGFLGVMDHKLQLSRSGTYFDYNKNGAQDVLFPVRRFSLDLYLGNKHSVTLLYQPLRLQTQEVLKADLSVDSLLYPAGTPVKFLYDFPFYRVSYLYNLAEGPERELAFGLSFQIRNATIEFESLDGALLRSTRDVGPVPILKFRWRMPLGSNFWVGSEADGFYAPVSYINGSDNEVVGAILDASLRGGMNLSEKSSVFMNVRYLGGGAVGESEGQKGPGDGYVKNWLHFVTVTAGFTWFFRE
jgi:hypothetical protein